MAENSYPVAGGAGVTDFPYEALMAYPMGMGRTAMYADRTLSVTPLVYADGTGRQVKVAPNCSYLIRGFRWESGVDALVVAIAANTSGKTRIDRVVLRLDRSTFTVRVAVLQGQPADSPLPPSMTRLTTTTSVFEEPLAQVRVLSNAATLVAADITSEYQWLMPAGHQGTEATRANIGVGGFYNAIDTDRLFFGASGKQLLVGENGPWTKIPAAGGWGQDSIYAQRVNGMVHFQSYCVLNTGTRAPSTNLVICNLPPDFRPQHDAWLRIVLSPGQCGFGYIDASTGNVSITDYPQTLPVGCKVVIGPEQWPSTGVASA